MRQTLVDEREHRRGLVLGLSLAEVLLLLLFLLLLALGHRLLRLDKERAELEVTLASFKHLISEQAGFSEVASGDALAKRLEGVVAIEKKISELFNRKAGSSPLESLNTVVFRLGELNTKLIEIEKTLGEVRPPIDTGSRIDPSDPPAVLIRAIAVLNELARLIPPKDAGPPAKPIIVTRDPTSIQTGTIDEGKKPVGGKGNHPWPPIITLSEADGYHFESGSAELSQDFENYLITTGIARLQKIIREYDVNVIEVIGHTDEQRILERPSNLDSTLVSFLRKGEPEPLVPADNAGLGLARAVSVVRVLAKDTHLRSFRILPLSGAQLIDIDDKLSHGTEAGPVKDRRRIEIRVRRSDKVLSPEGSAPASIEKSMPKPEPVYRGSAVVVDGDTIDIGSTRIRIWGVDAIETGQPCSIAGTAVDCAKEASSGLAAYLEGQIVTCLQKGRDRNRMIATCHVQDRDVGAWLVRQGLALDYADYSKKAYATEQANAKAEKRGIWRTEFSPPWVWRRNRRVQDGSQPSVKRPLQQTSPFQ